MGQFSNSMAAHPHTKETAVTLPPSEKSGRAYLSGLGSELVQRLSFRGEGSGKGGGVRGGGGVVREWVGGG